MNDSDQYFETLCLIFFVFSFQLTVDEISGK